MLLLSEADVARLIDPALALASAEAAFIAQAAGAPERPPDPGRLDIRRASPRAGALVLAGFGEGDAFLTKTNAHAYPEGGHRVARSLMVVWDMAAARPAALIATTGFNDHRTAAGFAVAAQVLAPREAATLAVFGAGKLARPSLRYLAATRPIRRALLVGRTPGRAEALAEAASDWPELAGIEIRAAGAEQAAAEADILCCATSAETPVFPGHHVRPGALVILGGANRPTAREADDVLIRRAVIHTDHTAGALAKAGDLAIPLAAGLIGPEAIAGEIGGLLSGARPVPALPPGFVHVFKSIGIAPQDLMLARALLARAEERGIGTRFDPEGLS